MLQYIEYREGGGGLALSRKTGDCTIILVSPGLSQIFGSAVNRLRCYDGLLLRLGKIVLLTVYQILIEI